MTLVDEVRRKRSFEGSLARKIRSTMAAIRRDILEVFPDLGIMPPLRPHQDALQLDLAAHYQRVQTSFAGDVPRRFGGLPEAAAPVLTAGLAAWVARRASFQSDVIITTVRKRRERALRSAQEQLADQQPTLSAMARVISNILGPLMRRQATTAAVTETQGAAESAKQISAMVLAGRTPDGAEGLTPLPQDQGHDLIKTWLTEEDERVRPAHVAANNQTIDVDRPFIVGGQRLMFPGDTNFNATLGNIINCRCSSLYEPRG